MKLTNVEHSSIAVLTFFSLIIFLHLGAGELQPWNEGLHAMRARSLVELKGSPRPSASQSVDEAISPVYPPLNVIMISTSMKLFGENEFSARVFSAVCSALSLVLLYLLARRFLSNEMSVAAAILLVGTLAWNTYSRQGMSNIPLTTIFLASLWTAVKIKESENAYLDLLWSFLFMITIFLGMMTEIIVSLLPLAFIIAMRGQENGKRKIIFLSAAFSIALAGAAYWYINRSVAYGAPIQFFNTIPSPLSSFEGGNSSIGVLKFLNMLIVSNPFFIFSLILAGIIIRHYKSLETYFESDQVYLVRALTLWFAVTLVVFAVLAGSQPYLIIYIIPPAVLLAVKMYANIDRIIKSKRLILVLLTLLASAAIWSFMTNLRQRADYFFEEGEYISLSLVFFWAAIIFSLLYALLATEKHIRSISYSVITRFWFMLLMCIIIRIVIINSVYNPGYSFGAEKTAGIIKNYGVRSFVYVYHQRVASDSLNPQLAWYTDGWTYGWQKTKSFVPVGMPEEGVNYLKLRSIDTLPDMPVVYYIPEDRELARAVIKDIMETRPVINMTQSYIVFGRKTRNRAGGVMV